MMKLKNLLYVLISGVVFFSSCDNTKVEVIPTIINLVDDEFSTKQNVSVELPVLANDEVFGENISIEISTPHYGEIESNSKNMSFLYTPNESFSGVEKLVYTVCINGKCKVANVIVDVKAKEPVIISECNFTIQAINDFISVKENEIFDVNLISNDFSCEDNLDLNTFSITKNIEFGKVLSSSNGILRIVMYEGFKQDKLSYKICTTEGDCSTGRLNIYNIDDNPAIK